MSTAIVSPHIQWPIFDRIYSNLAEAQANAETDGILIGRFILIKYSDLEFDFNGKTYLETQGTQGKAPSKPVGMSDTAFEQAKTDYYNNFLADGKVTKDRLILHKVARHDGNKYIAEYKELCYLNQADVWALNNRLENVEEFFGAATDNNEFDRLVEIVDWLVAHIDEYEALYNKVENSDRVTLLSNYQGDPEQEKEALTIAVENALNINHVPAGHIGIIEYQLDNHKVYNTYIYNIPKDSTVGVWQALHSNYRAEDVYFNDNLISTFELGKYPLTNGNVTIPTKGKNLKEVFEDIFQEPKNPQVVQPSVTAVLQEAGSYEVGSSIEALHLTAQLSTGHYGYGPEATDIAIRKTSGTGWRVKTNAAVGWTILADTSLTINRTYSGLTNMDENVNLSYSVAADHTEGAIPYNNLGKECSECQIAAGRTPAVNTAAITTYREGCFYGAYDNEVAINSSNIRNLGNSTGENFKARTITFWVEPGAKHIMIACPSTLGKVTNIENVTRNANMFSSFTEHKNVSVSGKTDGENMRDYNVWSFVSPDPYVSRTKFEVTLKGV